MAILCRRAGVLGEKGRFWRRVDRKSAIGAFWLSTRRKCVAGGESNDPNVLREGRGERPGGAFMRAFDRALAKKKKSAYLCLLKKEYSS